MTKRWNLLISGIPLLFFSLSVIAASFYFFSNDKNTNVIQEKKYVKDSIQFISFRQDSLVKLLTYYDVNFDGGKIENNRFVFRLVGMGNIANNEFHLKNHYTTTYTDTASNFFITKQGHDIFAAFEVSRKQAPTCIKVPTDILIALLEKQIENSNNQNQ